MLSLRAEECAGKAGVSLQTVTLRGAQAQPLVELQVGVEARIRDPDAAVDADELGNRGPPSILVRLASALMYLVPWIDIIGLGRMMYHKFPATLLLYVIPGASFKYEDACYLYRPLPAKRWR